MLLCFAEIFINAWLLSLATVSLFFFLSTFCPVSVADSSDGGHMMRDTSGAWYFAAFFDISA